MKQKSIFIYAILLTIIFLGNASAADQKVRIISLVPSQTEMLFYLGFGDNIVGTSDYCNFPEEARKKTRVGALELNIERIMSLRPTMLVDVNSMHKKYAPLFAQLGLNYINFTVSRMEHLPKMAEELAELISQPEKGKKFAAKWSKETASLSGKTTGTRPKVYFEIWDTPMQAAGKNSYIGDMIETAGGNNILSGTMDFPVVNSETILNANPDVIIIAYPLTKLDSINNRPGWQNLRAVKNKQIHALDQDLFIRPGPRNLEALQQLRKIFAASNPGK